MGRPWAKPGAPRLEALSRSPACQAWVQQGPGPTRASGLCHPPGETAQEPGPPLGVKGLPGGLRGLLVPPLPSPVVRAWEPRASRSGGVADHAPQQRPPGPASQQEMADIHMAGAARGPTWCLGGRRSRQAATLLTPTHSPGGWARPLRTDARPHPQDWLPRGKGST